MAASAVLPGMEVPKALHLATVSMVARHELARVSPAAEDCQWQALWKQ